MREQFYVDALTDLSPSKVIGVMHQNPTWFVNQVRNNHRMPHYDISETAKGLRRSLPRLWHAGITPKKIADIFSVRPSTVYFYRRQMESEGYQFEKRRS